MLGRAALMIWSHIATPALQPFRAWHNREHLPERIAIPGILRARRFRAQDDDGGFFVIYELKELAVLASASYRAVLDHPSPATLHAVSQCSPNDARMAAKVVFTAGGLSGGALALWVWRDEPDPAALHALCGASLAALAAHPSVAAITVLRAEAAAPAAPSAALAALGTLGRPACVLIVEAAANAADLPALCAPLLSHPALATARGPHPFVLEACCYQ